MQVERERLAELELRRQQEMQSGMQNQGRLAELEREILSMRGQWERDQMMLERYDGVSLGLRSNIRALLDCTHLVFFSSERSESKH